MKISIRSMDLQVKRDRGGEVLLLGPWSEWEEVELSPGTVLRVAELESEVERRTAEIREELERCITEPPA